MNDPPSAEAGPSIVPVVVSPPLRAVEEFFLEVGGCIAYWRGDIKGLVEDIAAAKPTMFAGVPRVFDRIYGGIQTKMKNAGWIKNALFHFAFDRKKHFMEKGLPHDKVRRAVPPPPPPPPPPPFLNRPSGSMLPVVVDALRCWTPSFPAVAGVKGSAAALRGRNRVGGGGGGGTTSGGLCPAAMEIVVMMMVMKMRKETMMVKKKKKIWVMSMVATAAAVMAIPMAAVIGVMAMMITAMRRRKKMVMIATMVKT